MARHTELHKEIHKDLNSRQEWRESIMRLRRARLGVGSIGTAGHLAFSL